MDRFTYGRFVMKHIDTLVDLARHIPGGCSDENRRPHSLFDPTCPRCFLLSQAIKGGAWDDLYDIEISLKKRT